MFLQTEEERARVDMLAEQSMDLRYYHNAMVSVLVKDHNYLLIRNKEKWAKKNLSVLE